MNRELLVLAMLIGASGCSMFFMETAPDGYSPFESEPRCTGHKKIAKLDVIVGVSHLVAAGIAGFAAKDSEGDTRTYLAVGAALDGGFAIGHFFSALTGSRWANECRAQRRTRDEAVRNKR